MSSPLTLLPGSEPGRQHRASGPWKPDELVEPTVTRTVRVDLVVPPGARRLLTLTEVLRQAGVDLPPGLEARLALVPLQDGVSHVEFTLEVVEP